MGWGWGTPTTPPPIALEAAEVIDDPDANETPEVEDSIAPTRVVDKVDQPSLKISTMSCKNRA
jgi:hypothetical protein